MSLSLDELLSLVRARSGHFVLESGYHSDVWLDLESLCQRPAALEPYIIALADQLHHLEPAIVCGPLVEGAFIALLTASRLQTDFTYALRSAGGPTQLFPVSYHLPTALCETVKGKRVLIVNDVISAGSAVRGAIADVAKHGGNVIAVATLLLLGDNFAEFCRARHLPLISLFKQEFHLWLPDACPLCAAGHNAEYLALH